MCRRVGQLTHRNAQRERSSLCRTTQRAGRDPGRFFEFAGDYMMTTLTVRIPTSVHHTVKELPARDDISVNQFIASAVAEKIASVMTLDYL